MSTKSYKRSDINDNWILVDAKGKTLGRFATQIANLLSVKNKPEYTKNADLGDYVIVINSNHVKVTGNKMFQKTYYRHSGYPGGIKEEPLSRIMETKSQEVIKSAVKGMLPKNKLGRQMLGKLKVYQEEEHPHSAQQPVLTEL